MGQISLAINRLVVVVIAIAAWDVPGRLFAAEVDYTRDIKPLLAEKCSSCHGALQQSAGLRLDAAALVRAGGESGPVVDPKSPAASLLLVRVRSSDPEVRMPPAAAGEPLTAEQSRLLEHWIALDLPAPADEVIPPRPEEHWAYQPIRPPSLPDESSGNPIDLLLARSQASSGVQPLPPADRRTLMRRVTFDLTGLPPRPEDVREFLADESADAWPRLIEKLLATPQYGERWGRHWMDVWRYSDWDGFQDELRGSQRHIWHWRDWIVESLNADKGYDRMVAEMLAGDELAPGDPDILRATGYLARSYHNSNRDIWLDAIVEHTAKAFLGMTLNCARCHDHKYDPLPQRTFYEMRAIFEPHQVRTDRLPGQPDLKQGGLPRVYDADLTAATYLYVAGNEKQPDKEHPIAPAVPALWPADFVIDPVELPAIARFPALAEHIEAEELAAARQKVAAAEELLRTAEASVPPPRTSATRRPADRPPGSALPRSPSVELQRARLKLDAARHELASLTARWQADRKRHSDEAVDSTVLEELSQSAARAERTHRVAVARLDVFEKWSSWRAAMESAETDPAQRATATAQALAALQSAEQAYAQAREAESLTDGQYTSVGQTYSATSSGRRAALAHWLVDSANPLTARVAVNHVWLRHFGQPLVDNVFDFGLRSPRPLQAEVLDWLAAELIQNRWSLKHLHRVILTSAAYQRASSGDAAAWARNEARDPSNAHYWRANTLRLEAEAVRDSLLAVAGALDGTLGGPDIDYAQGEQVYRRSLYLRHAYEKQMTMLVLFDAAAPLECYRRSESILPQQALALANSELSRTMAVRLADHLLATPAGSTPEAFTTAMFETVLARLPTIQEQAACLEFLAGQQQLLGTATLTDFQGQPAAAISPDAISRRAYTNLVHVLLNHNDFVTIR